MKKVLFTSILLLSAVSFGGNIYAQDATGSNDTEVTTLSATQPSVKFTADGNTLTISGQGDLTSYRTTDWSAKVFTANAVGFVFTDADGKTPVAAGDSYNAGKTYYHADYNYTKVWEGQPVAWNPYFGNVTAERSWKDNKKANLYMATIDAYNKNVTVGDKVSDKVNWDQEIFGNWNYTTIDGKEYVKVVEVTGEVPTSSVSFDNLQASGIKLIEVSELQSDFINTKVTYQIKDKLSLFLSSDGGKTHKGLTSGVDYEWTSDDVFYQGTATYAVIEDNNAFFDEHTDYVQADNTEISFKELLRRKILEGVSVYDYNAKKEVGVSSYTTVKFVNNGSDPLLIDADVVREILYPTSNGMLTTNVTTTKLDLGEATLNELNADIFIPSQDESYKCHKLALNDITFPKTKLTSVYSESTKQDENKMVLPAQLLSNITRYIKTVSIPEGYDRIADGAFSNENKQSVLENVNLPQGLTLIGKNAFQNCNYIKSIELNEGLENIGDSAFLELHLGQLNSHLH
jgi:surface antigen bspA-like